MTLRSATSNLAIRWHEKGAAPNELEERAAPALLDGRVMKQIVKESAAPNELE